MSDKGKKIDIEDDDPKVGDQVTAIFSGIYGGFDEDQGTHRVAGKWVGAEHLKPEEKDFHWSTSFSSDVATAAQIADIFNKKHFDTDSPFGAIRQGSTAVDQPMEWIPGELQVQDPPKLALTIDPDLIKEAAKLAAETFLLEFAAQVSGVSMEPEAKETWPNDEEQDAFSDWQYEVANGDTFMSFREWVDHREERALDGSDVSAEELMSDAIERAVKAEAELARVTGERDSQTQRLTYTTEALRRANKELDKAVASRDAYKNKFRRVRDDLNRACKDLRTRAEKAETELRMRELHHFEEEQKRDKAEADLARMTDARDRHSRAADKWCNLYADKCEEIESVQAKADRYDALREDVYREYINARDVRDHQTQAVFGATLNRDTERAAKGVQA